MPLEVQCSSDALTQRASVIRTRTSRKDPPIVPRLVVCQWRSCPQAVVHRVAAPIKGVLNVQTQPQRHTWWGR